MATSFDTFYKRLFLEWFQEHRAAVETEKEVGHLPLTIDMVAVCAPEDVARLALDTPFGFFLRHNLIEFKSPNDSLTEAEYNRIVARALLYAAQEKASRSEMTLNILTSSKPIKVLQRLAGLVRFERLENGHYVGKDAVTCHLFVASELPIEERYFPLLFLAKGQRKEAFLEELIRHGDIEYVQAYLDLYPDDVRKVIHMSRKFLTIEENRRRLVRNLRRELAEEFWDTVFEDLSAEERQQLLKRLIEVLNDQPTKPKRRTRKRGDAA